jgi:ribosomal protein S18 acetylase RimI-like enzyme
MDIHKLKESEVDGLHSFLKGKPGIAISMRVRPFLMQCAKGNTISLFCSRDREGRFQNVFTAYNVFASLSGKERKTGYQLVKQYSSGKKLEFLQELANRLEGRIAIENIEQDFAEMNGWRRDDESIELETEPRAGGPDETDMSEENKESVIDMLSEEWFTKEQARDYVETVLKNEGSFSKLAVDGGKVIAHAQASYYGKEAYIEAVYVLRKYRGVGAGTRVSQALLSKLASLGVKKAGLGVDESNRAAKALYEKLGFREVNSGYTYVMRE